jgi:hypothetical protein
MSKRHPNKRENATLQSGEGQPAFGQDERQFGVGGQTEVETIDENDAPHRDVTRDPTVPEGQSPSSRARR